MPISLSYLPELESFEWSYSGAVTEQMLHDVADLTVARPEFSSRTRGLLIDYGEDADLSSLDIEAIEAVRQHFQGLAAKVLGGRTVLAAHICPCDLTRVTIEHYIARTRPFLPVEHRVFTNRPDALAWLAAPALQD